MRLVLRLLREPPVPLNINASVNISASVLPYTNELSLRIYNK